MPFLKHLEELRGTVVRTCVGIAIGTAVAFLRIEEIFKTLTTPIKSFLGEAQLIGTGPADAFIVNLKLGLGAGFLISLPYTFLQIWRFVAPGMHEHERKFTIPFVVGATVFFLIGVSFCFAVVFPYGFDFFFAEYKSIGVTPAIRINEYLSFVLSFMLVFGIIFELPVFTYFLARVGLIDHHFLIRNFRYSVVAIFIIAALLTPPDVVSQLLLALPMLGLYGLCIWVAYAVRKSPSQIGAAGDSTDLVLRGAREKGAGGPSQP